MQNIVYKTLSITTFLCYLLLNTNSNLYSQNIYDLEHSLQFADYLYKTNQYELAAQEYERIVFLSPDKQNFKLKLIKSYRLSKNYNLALNKLKYFYEDTLVNLPNNFANEYVKLLLITNKNEKAFNYLDQNKTINHRTKQNYQLSSLLLQKKWTDAYKYTLKNTVINDNEINKNLHSLVLKTRKIKYKKPFVAAVFSTIIPGSGKIYTKYWKDAFIAFLFVGVNSWQAYRGFDKRGVNSAYGWVFASFATGFYIGNVFGSYKSAKKYNSKIDDEIYNEAAKFAFDNF